MSEHESERSGRPERRGPGGSSGRPAGNSGRGGRGDSSDRSGGRRSGERSNDRNRGDSRFEPRDLGRDRPGRGGDGRENSERPAWQTRVDRVRDDSRPKSPMIPEEITEQDLDLLVRVQFKTLSPENAERVSRHLAMVNLLIEQDPELAHRHAIAAAERAGRIAVVRETLGVTAYTVGDFALALRELQTYRRLSGNNNQIPLMVDSERGLGRPDRALELGRSVNRAELEPGVRVNLAIAMSGARLDRGENDLALAELEISELNPSKVLEYSPHLFRAYAHTLEILQRDKDAQRWHNLADRAEIAIAAKSAPASEVFSVIEEITIPEPYESRAPRADRDAQDRSQGERRRFDRPGGERRTLSDAENSGPRRSGAGPRRDGQPPRRDGGSRTGKFERRVEPDRPRREQPENRDSGSMPDSTSGESSPWKRPKSDEQN